MPLRQPYRSRVVLACLLAACVLFVSTTIVTGQHEHSVTHCCDFCHFGHLPWVQITDIPTVLPPDSREWRRAPDELRQTIEQGAAAESSRAPPAC